MLRNERKTAAVSFLRLDASIQKMIKKTIRISNLISNVKLNVLNNFDK